MSIKYQKLKPVAQCVQTTPSFTHLDHIPPHIPAMYIPSQNYISDNNF